VHAVTVSLAAKGAAGNVDGDYSVPLLTGADDYYPPLERRRSRSLSTNTAPGRTRSQNSTDGASAVSGMLITSMQHVTVSADDTTSTAVVGGEPIVTPDASAASLQRHHDDPTLLCHLPKYITFGAYAVPSETLRVLARRQSPPLLLSVASEYEAVPGTAISGSINGSGSATPLV
jgi:hypothetical protein